MVDEEFVDDTAEKKPPTDSRMALATESPFPLAAHTPNARRVLILRSLCGTHNENVRLEF